MAKGRLSKDKNGKEVQGFEPVKVITGTTDYIDISDYIAFRVSGYVDIIYTINGEEQPFVSQNKGTITVCRNIDGIRCSAAVNIEVM
jgi:hypothetical protein